MVRLLCTLCALLAGSSATLANAEEQRSSQSAHVDQYRNPLPPGAIGRIGWLRFQQGGLIYAAAALA
jgi:hypothetical protein